MLYLILMLAVLLVPVIVKIAVAEYIGSILEKECEKLNRAKHSDVEWRVVY